MAGAREQFESLGAAYAASKSHATGRTLQMVVDRAATNPGDLCCDVGTGTGHMALAMAERVLRVYATDVAAGMMRAGRALAAERGIPNVRWLQGAADRLPLPDAAVDVVVSRTAAHHFPSLPAACREWARIVRRGGRCVVTDQAGFDDPALQAFVHALEVLHDRTHVRAYTGAEWTAALTAAGFAVQRVEGGLTERLTELASGTVLDDWTRRSGTPPADAAEIRRRLENAPGPVTEALQIRGHGPDLRFSIYKLVVTARRT
jgi:SAM-dependent methyltransferase